MFIKIVILCLLAVILHHIWRLVSFFKPFENVYNHAPGPCHFVPGVDRGAEDLHLLSNGLVLVSSGLYRFPFHEVTEETHRGRLLLFDFNKPRQIEELRLPKFDTKHFSPHGISVWEDKNSDHATVFVVNHNYLDECVEKFDLNLKTHELTHVETIRDDLFIHINDIAATGGDSFYATIDFSGRSRIVRQLEMYLMMPWGSVVHYNGHTASTIIPGLLMPNSLFLSNDQRTVYLSLSGTASVNVFDRDPATNALELKQVYNVNTLADNLHVDDKGNIWLGAHSQPMEILRHLSNSSHSTHSQVLYLKTEKGLIKSMTEIYADVGDTLKGSSVAVYRNGRVLIGSVRDKLLLCEVKTL